MNRIASHPLPHSNAGAARQCMWFFLAMLWVSLGYILVTGTFNGDFYGVPVTLTTWQLALVTAGCIAPYFIGYAMYRGIGSSARAAPVMVSNRLLGRSFFVVTLWFIALAIKYDVGVLGRELYEAPTLLKPIIQISNRINPYYLGVFFIVGYRGSNRTIGLGIVMLIILGIVRAGLGVFMYILLALIVRNHRSLGTLLRRHFLKIALLACLLPVAASQLYSLRSTLRDKEDLDASLSATEIITARLVGRLSSISNAAFVVQENRQFKSDVRALDTWYFQRQALSQLFGVGVIPEAIPERLLINVNGGTQIDVSFMTGVAGNLVMAWMLSPAIALFNVTTMLVLMALSFAIGDRLGLPYRREVTFMLLLYPLTSGVGNEFAGVAVAMLTLVIMFSLLQRPFIRERQTQPA